MSEDSIASRTPSRERVVLALDIGTSSVRASLYDCFGNEIPATQARMLRRLSTTKDGGAELDADEGVEQVARTIDAALLHLAVDAFHIEAVAISCFWHSLVGVDARGHAATPLFAWADTRAAREAEELRRRFDEHKTHARTGAPFHPSYWPAKLLWLGRAHPEIYKRCERWMSFAEYLSLKLSGEARTSVSMAAGTGLMNTASCEWDEELLGGLGIAREQLPIIATERETFDSLLDEYAERWPALKGARWFPAIGDGAANHVGAGCASGAHASLMLGTSGAMRVMMEGMPTVALPSSLWCYRVDRRRVVIGGALSDGGGLWRWMNEALRLDADAEETERALAACEPDAHGLTVLPFWAGERSTGWSANARGAILGLSMHTRPVEILRAAMEAVAYRLALVAAALDEVVPEASIIASGGALRASALWAQMIADVLGRPVSLSSVEESSSRGAVLLALEATGKIKSIGEGRAPTMRTFEPDVARHHCYRAGLERQQKVYERLIADLETARLINNAAKESKAGLSYETNQRSEDNLKT